MKITEVKISLINPKNGIIGFASIVLCNAICLSSIAIHKKLNEDGYRVTYPKKGEFGIFYPINKNICLLIEQEILKAVKILKISESSVDWENSDV